MCESRMESSATTTGVSTRSRCPKASMSLTLMEVSGEISATMRSKSKMVTKSLPHWAMPVATPSLPLETVLSGFWMLFQEMRLMPTTVWTRNAMVILLKPVRINRSFSLGA